VAGILDTIAADKLGPSTCGPETSFEKKGITQRGVLRCVAKPNVQGIYKQQEHCSMPL
jgi:hypothetical protein